MGKSAPAAAVALAAALLLTACGSSDAAAPAADVESVEQTVADTGEAGTAPAAVDPAFAAAEKELGLDLRLGGLGHAAEWTSVSYDPGHSLTLVGTADAMDGFAAWTDGEDWSGWDTYTASEEEPYMFTAYGPLGSVVAQLVLDQDTFGVEIFAAE